MSKWLMLVVLVLVVLTAAVGLRNIATQSWDGGISVNAPSFTMAPTSAPPPAIPWK
ncbi:MAG TPA: hypothetical protein VJR26_14910 [Candidatus Acidoferrales bacterium]|nr:hypothetical protein [Candidatus Acidoferrales bacterium]